MRFYCCFDVSRRFDLCLWRGQPGSLESAYRVLYYESCCRFQEPASRSASSLPKPHVFMCPPYVGCACGIVHQKSMVVIRVFFWTELNRDIPRPWKLKTETVGAGGDIETSALLGRYDLFSFAPVELSSFFSRYCCTCYLLVDEPPSLPPFHGCRPTRCWRNSGPSGSPRAASPSKWPDPRNCCARWWRD